MGERARRGKDRDRPGKGRRVPPDADRPRLASLVDRSFTGQVVLDHGGRVLEANAEALRLLRTPYAVLIGRPLAVHLRAADRPAFARHLAEALEGSRIRVIELLFESAETGARFAAYLESLAVRGRDGERLCRTAIYDADTRLRSAREAREQGEREEAMRGQALAAQRRFDQIAAAGAAMAGSLDLGSAVLRAAQAAVDLCSYAAVDLVDAEGHVRRAAFAREGGVGPDLPLDPYGPRGSAYVIRTGRPEIFIAPLTGELRGLVAGTAALRELQAHVVSYLCLPLQAHGRTLGAMTFVRGSEPRFFPEDVHLATELARHAALAIDNARLYRESQEMARRKDEFLAMLGHELRNPLAAVVFAAGNLRLLKDASPAVHRLVEVVERQSARLTRLVDDLLEVSRVTRGKISLHRERVSFQEVVARAVESTRPLVESRRHRFRQALPAAPLIVDADPARLEQVVVNLLVNAAKYTDPGGHIDVDLHHAGHEAVLRVTDTGVGIPRDKLAHVFTPFTQIDPSFDRAEGGLGIGLALARNLVELHGGRISADSPGLGKGTEMVVRLPLASAAPRRPSGDDRAGPAPEPPSSSEAAEAAPPSRRRVLIAEDNGDLAGLLEEQIRALGHEVRVAPDGPAAVDTALSFQPDLLLIDLGLPGLTGYDVARRLRAEPALSGATMVAVTGYGGDDTANLCRDAGFHHHFTKPLREDALEGLLRAAS